MRQALPSFVRRIGAAVGTIAIALWSCGAGAPPARGADDFPYGRELLLDSPPMRGSKRLPGLDIARDGTVTIDLWCVSVPGQMVVAGNTVTVIAGPKPERQCPPDRSRGDDELLTALTQVTTWQRQGQFLILVGPRTLRYRFQTN